MMLIEWAISLGQISWSGAHQPDTSGNATTQDLAWQLLQGIAAFLGLLRQIT
jgi:hypothetical protein